MVRGGSSTSRAVSTLKTLTMQLRTSFINTMYDSELPGMFAFGGSALVTRLLDVILHANDT